MSDYQRKAIEGFPGYEIDTEGVVWSCWINKCLGRGKGHAQILGNITHKLKQSKLIDKRHSLPRLRVSLRVKGNEKHIYVHKLVAQAFILNPNNFPKVCHEDSNPLNNNVKNLRWDTQKRNMKDRINRNLYGLNKGEKNGGAKLTEKQVIEIKKIGNNSPKKKTASIFKVHEGTIQAILSGKTWKHVII